MKLTVDHITKVEGHGRLHVKVNKGDIECVEMQIFEGARYFESLVKDRDISEVPAITSRICGICSQSHLICALTAIEKAIKVKPSPQTETLRQLIMLGSIMQSHVLHLYFLALPDYLGYDNALAMAKKYPKEVKRALKLKSFANRMVSTIAGREIHSERPVLGGFAKLPTQEEIDELFKDLKEHKDDFYETAKLFAKLKQPKFERDTRYAALRNKDKSDYVKGDLYTDEGKKVLQNNYASHIKEKVVPYSNTKCVMLGDREFMVGALARINVNKRYLSRNTKQMINQSKITFPNANPYMNNAAQGFELVDLYDKAQNLLRGFKIKDEKPKPAKPKSGRGVAIIEAPRGLLIHEYEVSAKGKIKKANIIAPTTQNLKNIEEDVKELLPGLMRRKLTEKKMRHELERIVRAYDPCISCSTHFLDITWEHA